MGEIQNPRHERFAQELAAGNSADSAYEAAGYRKHRGNAARLSANERIKNRVREIQSIRAERAAVTVQNLIEEATTLGPALEDTAAILCVSVVDMLLIRRAPERARAHLALVRPLVSSPRIRTASAART